MLGHLHEHLEGERGNVRTGLRSLHHVKGMTNAGSQHLGLDPLLVIDVHDVRNHLHSIMPFIIKPAYERADVLDS